MYLGCIVYSLFPCTDCQKCLASLDENALWGVGMEGQSNRITGDGLVMLLSIYCRVPKMLQFLDSTLPEI